MTVIHSGIPVRVLSAVLIILLLLTLPVTARAARPDALRIPVAGREQEKNQTVTIDTTNISQGYIMCSYTGEADKTAVQVQKSGSDTVYTYYIPVTGDFAAIPFTEDSGRYTVKGLERISGKTYIHAEIMTVNVTLEDELLPFLYSSYMIRFGEDSLSVEKGRELAEKAGGDAETIAAVHAFLMEKIRYDHEKAEKLTAGYIANPDEVLKRGKGVCIDYAALMAAMLRPLSIPTQMVYGWTADGQYHCWVRVYSKDAGKVGNVELKSGAWTLLDPTYAANVRSGSSWSPDENDYKAVYTY